MNIINYFLNQVETKIISYEFFYNGVTYHSNDLLVLSKKEFNTLLSVYGADLFLIMQLKLEIDKYATNRATTI